MSDSLFDIPVQLSPRLAWAKKHNIKTHHTPGLDLPWMAVVPFDKSVTGYGMTEEDAMVNMTKNAKILIGLRRAHDENHP